MKKLFFVFLMVFTALSVLACNGQTTQAPTTAAPTTVAPTTVAPTTAEPTTAAPTTLDIAPVFSGVEDRTVIKGATDFDLLEGITINDDFDTNLLEEVVVTGEVDLTTAGEYPITLTVTDVAGNTVTAEFTVTVILSEAETKALADIEAIVLNKDSNGNYILPTLGTVNASTIIWTTDRSDVITRRGFVIKPGIGEDPATVILTANVIQGSFKTTVPFEVVVEPNVELNGITSKVSLPFEGTSTEYVVANQEAVDVFFADNGALPYIDVQTFINLIDGAIDSSIVSVIPVGEDILRVEYSVEFEDFDGTMVTESYWAEIDFTANTFTVNNFSFFENYVASTSSDYGEGLTYVDAAYVDGQQVTIPLGFYSFDLLIHTEGETTYYLMPLHVTNLLFAGNIYYDVYYNGDKLWGIDTFTISGPDEAGLALLDQIRTSSFNSLTAPKDIRWATYNFLALSIDYFYGLRDRYDVNSYYEILSAHAKDIILSTDQFMYQKVFQVAYSLDDLHTSHVFTGYYDAPFDITLYLNDLGPKTVMFYEGLWAMQDLLTAKFGSPDSLPTTARLIDNDKTAIIYLTGFTIDSPNEFKAIMDTLPTTVENVVIDLAYNTGGNLGAVLRIFGYMTENPIVYHSQNPADGAAVSYFIDSSYVAYDYNWFIVTSSVTFSAANLMASMAKEQGIATVIGKNSSGGASSIGAIYSPDGSCLLISTNNVLSTYIDGEYFSIEDGIEVEYLMSNVTSDSILISVIEQVNAGN
ncbi:MAG: S41 family peptidase [Candidatus Izemoplasmatales bacterium]|nr:S41 family peptidase [Candidatus Izemoplasmatales bacterium]